MMYRLVFAPNKRVPGEREKGPWLPSREVAEQWRDYFNRCTSSIVEAIEDSAHFGKQPPQEHRGWT